MRIRTLLFLSLALALTACSDDATTANKDGAPPPDTGLPDGPIADASVPDSSADLASADQATLDSAGPDLTSLDASPPDQIMAADTVPADFSLGDFSLPKAQLQAVVNKINLPTTSTLSQLYAFDLDGNGSKDNGLGTILATVALLGGTVDLQSMVNDDIKKGNLIYLMEVLGSALASSNPAWVQVHLGVDTDGNAANNFSGSAKLAVSTGSPKGSFLKGKVVSGQADVGPNDIIAPLPLSSGAAVLTSMKKSRLKGMVSTTGVTNGVLGGAIPMTEINTKVVPIIASILDRIYNDPLTDSSTKSLLKTLFDTNADGKITAKELQANILVKSILVPDLDTDGDKVKDALSLGFGFTAVSCQIQ